MSWRAQISRNVREIRFLCCGTSKHSQGVRDFFQKNYAELKMLNPATPFVYRELDEAEPFIAVRYDWGQHKQVYLGRKNDSQVLDVLKDLVEQGAKMPKSPESDLLVPAPIIDGMKGESAFEPLNLTWDGKTIRRNPLLAKK